MLGLPRRRNRQTGDTLIEVLFAITVFSLVAVGSLSIMNEGSSIAERSLERTLVRNEINGQVEALRYLHDAYLSAYTVGGASKIVASNSASATAAERWRYIVDSRSMASPINLTNGPGNCALPKGTNTFAIDPTSMNIMTAWPVQAVTYARINSTPQAEGIWVESVGPSPATDGSNTRYIDFYIQACWSSIGQTIPMTAGTVVRLYEPAS